MTTKQTSSGGAFLAQTLKAYGIEHIFFVDAVLRHMLAHAYKLGIGRTLAHSEKAAAYMADGYARAARRPSVCMAQSVGAANLAAGLQDARFAGSPVIALTGRHVQDKQYRHAYQELAHQPLFAEVTKFSGRVETPFQLAYLTRQAFRIATSGAPGPVHLDMAGHIGDVTDYWQTDEEVFAEPRHSRVPAQRPRPDPTALRELAAALAQAQAPVLVVGAGAYWSDAREALTTFARRHSIPVLCSLDAKALMAGAPELDAGVTGTYGTDAANRLLAQADFVMFIGSDTGDQITSNWKLPAPGVPTAHVGLEAEALGSNLRDAIAVHADPATALRELDDLAQPQERNRWCAQVGLLKDQWWTRHEAMLKSDTVPIRPERICAELGRWLPSNAVVVADTGFASQWTSQLLQLREGQTFLRAVGSLGWAFPAALGAKAALPGQPVICFTGDGGFMYHLPELETALRRGLHTITVVNNNGCLAQGQKSLLAAQIDGAGMAECCQFVQQDFAAIANAMGCVGLRVERPQELPAAFDLAQRADRPVVIDVRTTPDALATIPWMPGSA